MELKFFFFLISTFLSLSSSESQNWVTRRNLLQTKKKCEVNFEYMDYNVMKRQCKGPKFPAKECCEAFKEFACPYVKEINDMSSDCSRIMFSYMNRYGNYPPGLFANECKETKHGLICPSHLSSTLNAAVSTATCCRMVSVAAVAAALAFVAFITNGF